jgi:hypothetical protein
MQSIRRSVALAALVAFGFQLGCSSVSEVPMSDAMSSGGKVQSAILRSGETVEFDDGGGVINSDRGTIDGKDPNGKPLSIKIDDTSSVRVRRTDPAKIGIYAIVVFAIAGTTAWIINTSR